MESSDGSFCSKLIGDLSTTNLQSQSLTTNEQFIYQVQPIERNFETLALLIEEIQAAINHDYQRAITAPVDLLNVYWKHYIVVQLPEVEKCLRKLAKDAEVMSIIDETISTAVLPKLEILNMQKLWTVKVDDCNKVELVLFYSRLSSILLVKKILGFGCFLLKLQKRSSTEGNIQQESLDKLVNQFQNILNSYMKFFQGNSMNENNCRLQSLPLFEPNFEQELPQVSQKFLKKFKKRLSKAEVELTQLFSHQIATNLHYKEQISTLENIHDQLRSDLRSTINRIHKELEVQREEFSQSSSFDTLNKRRSTYQKYLDTIVLKQ